MSEAATVQGMVKTLNFAPKGEIDAVMIEADGQMVQVNLAPAMGDHAKTLIGQEITVHVKPEMKETVRPYPESMAVFDVPAIMPSKSAVGWPGSA